MSAGRYTFVHSTDREARGKAGGLGLDILDGWSGLVRPAKTLSGGESFLASLALALGLADVVAAEAGGRVLDTLFVDEGFGSLDPDTLDLVMETLDELRAGGRVVGVVSHVDELRQRIPEPGAGDPDAAGIDAAGDHGMSRARLGLREATMFLLIAYFTVDPTDRPSRHWPTRRNRFGCWPRSRTPGRCAGAGRPRTPDGWCWSPSSRPPPLTDGPSHRSRCARADPVAVQGRGPHLRRLRGAGRRRRRRFWEPDVTVPDPGR